MGQWGIRESQKYSWPKIASRVLDFYQFCRKEKQKRKRKEKLPLEQTFTKIFDIIYNKDILNWLKKLK